MKAPAFPAIHDPYAALRYEEFRRYVGASFLFTVSLLIQEVVLGYELYTITRDPLALGLTGLAEAVPFIGLSLFGGHIADRMSKRKIILWSVTCITFCSFALQLFARFSSSSVGTGTLVAVIYSVVFLIGVCRAFQSPAGGSLRAFLVPMTAYENAAMWNSSTFQAASIIGPALSGFLYAWLGFSSTLLVVVGLLVIAWYLFSRIADRGTEGGEPATDLVASVKEGIRFVAKTKIILYAISLDLFSVLFGGVVAILPIYAQDILKVGAEGLGILRAAPSAGAVLMLVVLARVSPMRHAWRNLIRAVAGFGVSILVFAVSPWMALSSVALFLSGAFDSVSVVIRQTLLQLKTPDEMRGRVMSVNGIFISSSNELGAFESGLAARIMGVVPSAIFGGLATLAIVVWVSLRTKELRDINLLPGQKSS